MCANGVFGIRRSSCLIWRTWWVVRIRSFCFTVRADMADQKVCPHKHTPPPGLLIYAKDEYAIYEVDGEEHKLYTQNLSLFAKLFLDTKSVFYDVTTFRYYLLAHRDPTTAQQQVVGFFSKEKMSWDNNNVACILVFPPWQKKGLGQILIGVSYELSKREGRLGGPEKRMLLLYPDSFVYADTD